MVDLGAKLGRTFAAERAQDAAVNLFEATADHARKLAGEETRAVRLVVRGLVRSAWGPCWPTMA